KNELPKHCVSVDYGTLSMLTGNSKSNARAGMRRACEAGALILLHPGSPYRAGTDGGLPAMYGIVGDTETVADVWDRAIEEDALKRRYAEIPVSGCSDVSALPFIPTPLFWDTVDIFSRQKNIIPFEKRAEATGVTVASACDSGVAA
ncbi:MAG TPA: hypothetical protein VFN37_12445, partial [Candidatus Baltobacteraceae bacterium]|nr:hypothetical protein [Candidatus Baltobacteraceae bacterium]